MWWAEKTHALTARPVVVGRVLCDDARPLSVAPGVSGGPHPLLGGPPPIAGGRRATLAKVRTHPGVVGQRHQFLVSRDGVDPVGHSRDGRLAQLVEERIGIGAVFVPHRGVKGFLGGHVEFLGYRRRVRNSARRSLGSWPVKTTSGVSVGTPRAGKSAGITRIFSGKSKPGGCGGNGPDRAISSR